METLKGLDLVENVTKPIPDLVRSYYRNNFANGTGEFGTFTMQDFLGSAIGVKTKNALENTNAVIANMNISTLNTVCARMLATVSGTYGPVTGPIIIPAGPASGTYANGNAAFTNGLIPAANAAIFSLIATYPLHTASLNNSFNSICNQYEYEYFNQTRANLDFANLVPGGQQATISFMSGLQAAGQDNEIGGQNSFLIAVVDASNQTGQALLGALREGRNNLLMDKA